eukprot:SAG22_NODE_1121_length_5508_cov_6.904234_8_plen_73_part_00
MPEWFLQQSRVLSGGLPTAADHLLLPAGRLMRHACRDTIGIWEVVAILTFCCFLFVANSVILYIDLGITSTP